MREIIPSGVESDTNISVSSGNATPAGTYKKLVRQIANLAYANKDHLLFFRGQHNDFLNRGGSSTFYPTIYRGDYLPKREVKHRFELLKVAGKKLGRIFEEEELNGYREVKRKKYIQWSILQHYGVCRTPLLDFTHSLRVACSFATMDNPSNAGYVIVFGLPYITNRITINSEHDLVNIRLLSICPPSALRPYFQEGYLAGTTDITTNYESKSELDFNRRLIAKFTVPDSAEFWGEEFGHIPREVLYPENDHIMEICESIELSIKEELEPGQIGEFLKEWVELEESLTKKANIRDQRNYTIREAINQLVDWAPVEENLYVLDRLRKFRNQLVHEPKQIDPEELNEQFDSLIEIKREILNH